MLYGIGMGTVYAMLQLAVQVDGRTPDASGVLVPVAILLDLTGGAWGGWIASVLLPKVRSWYAAAMGGFFTVGPVSVAFGIADDGLSRRSVASSLFAALLIGSMVGASVWFRYRRDTPAQTRQRRRRATRHRPNER